jgi:predicted esterase
MVELFKVFGFNPGNKVSLFGYDLGGAIALSSCMHRTLGKCISSVVAFHPTWTDSV